MRRSKQQKAYDQAQIKAETKWLAEEPITPPEKTFGQYLRTMERNQGFATGWIAAVAWMKRERKKSH